MPLHKGKPQKTDMRHLRYILAGFLLLTPIILRAREGDSLKGGLWPASCANVMEREVRAVWLTTYNGLDWPRRVARNAVESERQKAELLRILDELQEAGINTVLFQTRVRATTTYASAIEPWDASLTGEAGRSPLYDPLALAIEECHKRGMELHAWVVTFPIEKVSAAQKLGSRSLPKRCPELCRKCGEQWMMDPGVPATATYLATLCAEIVRNYDVDGIHLDYIRYPEASIAFSDRDTYRRYGKGKPLSQWRRENVTRCVQTIHDSVKSLKPWVKMSCSPVGKYADLPRQSSYGWNARDAVCQDAKLWLREGWMDLLFPMMYFDGKHFYPFVVDWNEDTGGKPVVPGLGIYFLNDRERGWPLEVVRRQMCVTRLVGCGGQAMFRSKFFTDNEKGLYDFCRDDFYRVSQLPPAVDGAVALPQPPQWGKVSRSGFSLVMQWEEVPVSALPAGQVLTRANRYNVYRCPEADFCAGHAVRIATGVKQPAYHYQPALPSRLNEFFFITTFDAFGNESAPFLLARDSWDAE